MTEVGDSISANTSDYLLARSVESVSGTVSDDRRLPQIDLNKTVPDTFLPDVDEHHPDPQEPEPIGNS